MKAICIIIGIVFCHLTEVFAQNAEIFKLEKLYDPRTAINEFVAWKNDGLLIPIRYDSKNFEKVKVSFSGIDADFQLYELHEVKADFSAGYCGSAKENGTFEQVMVPERAELRPDLTFIPSDQSQWLLIRIKPKSSTPTGKFQFVIHFLENEIKTDIKGKITVKNQILIDPSQVEFYTDFWQYPVAISDYYQVKPWSAEHWEQIEEMFEMLSGINQQSITTSVFWDLYNSRIKGLDEMMIQVTKTASGEFTYDYSVFEKFVEMGIEKGISEQISVHNLFPWNQFHFYFDETSQEVKSVAAAPGSTEYQDFWKPFLVAFADFLKAKNWMSKTLFFIDERDANQSVELINWVKQIDPEFEFGFSGAFSSNLSNEVNNYSVPANVVIDPEYLSARAASNKLTSLYTACFDQANQPNMLMTSDYRDTYFLVFLAKARGYNGVLRWAFNKWSSQIKTDGIYSDVPSGDAHFVYPDGEVSVRYLVLQDALEEIAKLEAKGKNRHKLQMNSLLKEYSSIKIEKDRFETVQSMKNYLND